MSTENDYDFDDSQAGSSAPDVGKLREAHSKASKRAKEAETRAEQAERRLAFAEAGLDLSDKKVKYFIAGYDGELEADKIRKAAVDDGFLADPAAAKEAQAKESEADEAPAPHPDAPGFQQMNDATSGADPNTQSVDLRQGMVDLYEKGADADAVAQYLAQHGHPVTSYGD